MAHPDLYAFSAAFLVALAGTRAIEFLARRRSVYAPVSWRGAHTRPTPRLAGPALASGIAIGLLIGLERLDERAIALLVGAAVLLAVGLADDLRSLPVLPRSAIQLSVALGTAVVLAPDLIITLPGLTMQVQGWPAIVLAAVWVAALVNIFNFMDGIDGLVAGTTAAIAVTLLAMGGSTAASLAIALAGACLGFLVWNQHPASIFMGDGGSQVLGYAVATGFLLQTGGIETIPALLAVAPFIADTSGTLLRRAVERENIFKAHHEHLFQRLARNGWNQRTVSGIYVAAALVAGLIATTYVAGGTWWQLLAIVGYLAAGSFVTARLPNPRNAEGNG